MKVYIVGAKRTAIGSMLGSLKNMQPAVFGAQVLSAAIEQAGIKPENLDEVIVGNVLCAGYAQGVARQTAIKAGVPQEVPAYGINMICGSGLKSVMNGVTEILAGNANLVATGGTESMSGAPYLLPGKMRGGQKMGEIRMIDHMVNDALTDAFSGVHMGITAENIAEKYGITRLQQDEFAFNSQQKAMKASDSGAFDDEIVPIEIVEKKNTFTFNKDEFINRTTTPEKMAGLRPAFKEGGTVTSGNASGINDGASFVILASEKAVKEYNLKPIAEIIAVGQGGVDPQYMGLGPVPAIRMALKRANLKLSDVEILELNEAFAAQSLGVVKLLSEEHGMSEKDILARTNPNGGAIALGHPVGASGNRILVTLLYELLKSDKKLGLASLCIGGGMGVAVIVKKCK
jgi:acetyl-CoA C-acetyltransferase